VDGCSALSAPKKYSLMRPVRAACRAFVGRCSTPPDFCSFTTETGFPMLPTAACLLVLVLLL
jgi:hypothetical protein